VLFVVVLDVHLDAHHDLLDVRQALGLPRRFASLGKHGEEDGRKNGDDCDHHEQFDKGERPAC
jgi:hypothetical protein